MLHDGHSTNLCLGYNLKLVIVCVVAHYQQVVLGCVQMVCTFEHNVGGNELKLTWDEACQSHRRAIKGGFN